MQPKMDEKRPAEKPKTYKEMMAEIMKPKPKKDKKPTCLGGGQFTKVVPI